MRNNSSRLTGSPSVRANPDYPAHACSSEDGKQPSDSGVGILPALASICPLFGFVPDGILGTPRLDANLPPESEPPRVSCTLGYWCASDFVAAS